MLAGPGDSLERGRQPRTGGTIRTVRDATIGAQPRRKLLLRLTAAGALARVGRRALLTGARILLLEA